MAVIRTIKNDNYTTMSNYHLKDKNISLKAKGLLSIMLSLPEEWHYSVDGLTTICKESKNTVNSVLKELEDNGYLLRQRKYVDGKISEWEYLIFENNDNHDDYLHPKNLYPKNEDIENEDIENWDVYKYTNKSNTKELNTNKEKTIKKESIDSVIHNYTNSEELVSALLDFKEMRKVLKKPLTPRAMKQCLKKLDGLDEESKVKVVLQSVEHGWLTFYELKDIKSFTKNGTTVPQWYTKTEQHVASDELKDEVEDMLRNLGG